MQILFARVLALTNFDLTSFLTRKMKNVSIGHLEFEEFNSDHQYRL